MIKLVNMLVRADDLTHEEFVDYWYDEHVPLAKGLPHAKKYATSVPTDPDRSEYDGVVELYFEDMGDLQAAFESDVGEAVQADLAEFAKPDEGATLYVEETVQFDDESEDR
ncbi:EthD family reductase [Halorubellus sp. JP-L1]|uniref:EthD family reductase n=1 Tax=Halorubellus sp. JP-L1 TaxID=2715753 RepID=UPI00140806B8|nr:EthD family reductase [Halorubellus sp. JP-L1]NHN40866.1 EthD family reductase [Halorubellus sp. JP-L1]